MRLHVENDPWRVNNVCIVREEEVHPIKGKKKPDVKVCILYIGTVAMRLTAGWTQTGVFEKENKCSEAEISVIQLCGVLGGA